MYGLSIRHVHDSWRSVNRDEAFQFPSQIRQRRANDKRQEDTVAIRPVTQNIQRHVTRKRCWFAG